MVRTVFGAKIAAVPLASVALIVLAGLSLGGCNNDSSSSSAIGDTSASYDAAAMSDKSRRFGRAVRTPVNRMPSISGAPATSAQVGKLWNFAPQAADPENQKLAFSIANKPGWLTFDAATGALSGTPSDSDAHVWPNISVSVSDGAKSASLTPFSITVAAAPTVPPPVTLASATLSWVAPDTNTDNSALTDLAGFRIYYGKAANALDQIVRVTNPTVTQQVIDNLVTGTWYFAVSAVSSSGAESALSTLASKSFP